MSKPFENAFWIWDDGDPAPVNAYRIFRKTLPPDADRDETLTVRICADTRYKLYVNGEFVCHGPAPSAKGRFAYDEVEIAGEPDRYLTVAVVVNYVGAPMFFYHQNRGGLLFEMGDVVSDESWFVAVKSPWLSNTPRLSVEQGHGEYYDQGIEFELIDPFGAELAQEEYEPAEPEQHELLADLSDPEKWKPVSVVAPAYAEPWPILEPRDIPLPNIDENYASFPGRLIGYGNFAATVASDDVAERMTNEALLPLRNGTVTSAFEEGQNVVEIDGDGGDVYLLYDFGREVSGFVHLTVSAESGEGGEIIDIGYDETLREGETPSGLVHAAEGSRIRMADRFAWQRPGGYFASFSSRAFRYMRLSLHKVQGRIQIDAPWVEETTYPAREKGVFTCSDARLDQMWEIGRRTLLLCMEDRFMDCPWRERAQWVGDARIQAIGAVYCFGDSLLHRRFLRQTALSQYPDGRIDPVGPGDWDVYTPNKPIPGFVAIYIQSVLDYYLMTGDGDLIVEVLPAVQKALGWLASYGAGEGGLLSGVRGWNFTDWAAGLSDDGDGISTSDGRDGITAAVNLFYLQALRAAARLAELSGDVAAAASNRTRADMVAAAFDSLFWSPLRGEYVDAVVGGQQSANASQQVNTLALLTGVGAQWRRDTISEGLLSDDTLTQIGSPYFSFYLVEALAKVGRQQEALEYIRDHWGAMLDAGATSWWEEWHGKSSRCHAWSIAPNIWLPQQILGVTPGEPGFSSVDVAPKPCDLTWAKGIVPIPAGDVVISWLKTPGKFQLDVTVPTGVLLHVTLPSKPSDTLMVDGGLIAEDAVVRRSAMEAEIAVLPGSGYRFEVVSV